MGQNDPTCRKRIEVPIYFDYLTVNITHVITLLHRLNDLANISNARLLPDAKQNFCVGILVYIFENLFI